MLHSNVRVLDVFRYLPLEEQPRFVEPLPVAIRPTRQNVALERLEGEPPRFRPVSSCFRQHDDQLPRYSQTTTIRCCYGPTFRSVLSGDGTLLFGDDAGSFPALAVVPGLLLFLVFVLILLKFLELTNRYESELACINASTISKSIYGESE